MTLVATLLSEIHELKKEVSSLRAELAIYKNPKNSGNSHIPPSKDENRIPRNQSLREKSNKNVGGQVGHQGNTLKMIELADEYINHTPDYCSQCGKDLSIFKEEMVEKRQVIDIPIVMPICTEHAIYRKTCSCGHCTTSTFPFHVKSPVQYGPRTEAMISYLHSRQYLPFNRIVEYMQDVFGLPISEGGIHCLLKRFTGKAENVYQEIKRRIELSDYIGTDETGAKVNGKRNWFWTWQNEQLTFIAHSLNRGIDTIKTVFKNGLPNAHLTHDRWASHFHCKSKGHQVCTSHLLRELNYLEELYKSKWAISFKNLLKKAIELKKSFTLEDYYKPNKKRQEYEMELTELLEIPIDLSHHKAVVLQKSLRKLRDSILLFLYHPKIPPDNNGSERSIRNIKVKQKISGQFKSTEGARIYAVNRSVIDTIIKSNQKVLDGLILIANLETI